MSIAVFWGKACQRHATSPATRGVENEVPISLTIVPRPEMSEVGLPKAITSGLTRPSCVGPTPLKGAFIKLVFTAPTVRMSLASAGKTIFFQGPMPLLPAELTSMIPLRASIEAERLMNAVSPSRSRW